MKTTENRSRDNWWLNGETVGEVLDRARLRLIALRGAHTTDPNVIRLEINDALEDLDGVVDALVSLDELSELEPNVLGWAPRDGSKLFQPKTGSAR